MFVSAVAVLRRYGRDTLVQPAGVHIWIEGIDKKKNGARPELGNARRRIVERTQENAENGQDAFTAPPRICANVVNLQASLSANSAAQKPLSEPIAGRACTDRSLPPWSRYGLSKPALHLIQPRRVGWRVVNVIVGPLGQPGAHLTMFVRGIVVHNQVRVEWFWNTGVQAAQKREKLLMS